MKEATEAAIDATNMAVNVVAHQIGTELDLSLKQAQYVASAVVHRLRELGWFPTPVLWEHGWTLAPQEPTYQMCQAGKFSWESWTNGPFPERYKAMLQAARSPSLENAGK